MTGGATKQVSSDRGSSSVRGNSNAGQSSGSSSSTKPATTVRNESGSSSTRPATSVRNDDSAPKSYRDAPSASNQNGNHGGNSGYSPRPDSKPQPPRDDFRPQHPRERDYLDFDSRPPHHFYDPHHDHCFGYRVHALPAGYWYRDWYGVRYYCYDDIYYRLVDGCYVVCRPPFGTSLAAAIVADAAWTAVRVSYYNTLNNTYDKINSNNAYIAEQNAQIARNNALLAQQNAALAAQSQFMAARSNEAYQLAIAMGLVQSYADAGSDYFCQDGVFYRNIGGQYYVIVPPAGALIDSLPEDYDVFLFNGREYYQVDNTVYRVTVVGGRAYFEVLGQK